MSKDRRSPFPGQPQDEDIHPTVAGMTEDQVAALSGIARAVDGPGLAHLSDAAVASSLLRLQEEGHVTLCVDFDTGSVGLRVHSWSKAMRLAEKRRGRGGRV